MISWPFVSTNIRCSVWKLTFLQAIATSIIGYAGYLMFGSDVSDEVSNIKSSVQSVE